MSEPPLTFKFCENKNLKDSSDICVDASISEIQPDTPSLNKGIEFRIIRVLVLIL